MSPAITVLVADDHPLVRSGVRAILDAAPDIEIVAETDSATPIPGLCQRYHPAVLVLDIHMPGPALSETVAWMQQHCPQTALLLLSGYVDARALALIQAAGVAGYMIKDESVELLVPAIRSVARGASWYSQAIVAKELMRVADPLIDAGLTEREIQVLAALARGYSNNQIGQMLALAGQTVRNSVSHIYAKIGVRSRPKAVLWAYAHGLGRERGAESACHTPVPPPRYQATNPL